MCRYDTVGYDTILHSVEKEKNKTKRQLPERYPVGYCTSTDTSQKRAGDEWRPKRRLTTRRLAESRGAGGVEAGIGQCQQ